MTNIAGNTTAAEGLDYSQRPVPEEGRMPALSLTMAYWSCCSAMVWIVLAGTLAKAYGTMNALIGLALSVVAFSAVNYYISRYALRTGLSVSLFSRQLFGTTGSILATLIFTATAIYYAVFEGAVVSWAITFHFDNIGYALAALIIVIYSVPLILGSVQHWLDKFNGILLPIYFIGLAGTIITAIYNYGYTNDWLSLAPADGAPPNGWFDVFVFFMGVWVMMMFTFDFARFGRRSDEKYHAVVTFGWPFYVVSLIVNGLAGIFLVGTLPVDGALTEISAVKGIVVMMGFIGLLFVWVTQTRINTANYYLASVNLEALARLTFGVMLPKWVWAVVVGVIVYLLMLADVVHYMLTALAYQGVFIVAWVGIALAYIVQQGRRDADDIGALPDSAFPAFEPAGLIAWFGSVIVGIVLMNVPALAQLSAPVTAVCSFALFAMLPNRARQVAA